MADGSGDAEDPMDIVVNVIDQNDNNPIFVKDTFLGEVAEASPRSTVCWSKPKPRIYILSHVSAKELAFMSLMCADVFED